MRVEAAFVVVCCALLLCVALTKRHVTSWNDGSRFATVDSLVANHTFAIDGSTYGKATGDKIRVRGRTFSDKPPLLAILGAGVASIIGVGGINLRQTQAPAIFFITLCTVGACFGLGCAYAYAFQRRFGFSKQRSAAVAAVTGFATLALPYAMVFTNHVPAGVAGLAGCYHVLFERERQRGPLLGGLFLSIAYAFDPAAIVFVLAAAILLAGAGPRQIGAFLLACLPVVAAQLSYNLVVTGSILPPIFNASVWNDPSLPEYQPASTPVVGVFSAYEYARFAFDALLGNKGLFVFTPVAAICAFGVFVMRSKDAQARRLALAIAATTSVLFALIVLFQNDEGSRNFGERRFVDVMFLMCTSLGYAFGAVRGAAAALAVRSIVALSIVFAALGSFAPFGGAAGQSGFMFAWRTFTSIAQTRPSQAIEDIVGVVLLVAGVLWLTRGVFSKDVERIVRVAPPLA